MSKIGKMPIEIKEGVQITIDNGGDFNYKIVTVTGPEGTLTLSVRKGISLEMKDKELIVSRDNDERQNKAYHGLFRSLIANMVTGVVEGYQKTLEIHGVGYRGSHSGNSIELNLGFSHKVPFKAPEGITLAMPDQNTIVISGADKQQVGQVAALIRGFRKPEPYKGKGIRYAGEVVKRKAGKTASK